MIADTVTALPRERRPAMFYGVPRSGHSSAGTIWRRLRLNPPACRRARPGFGPAPAIRSGQLQWRDAAAAEGAGRRRHGDAARSTGEGVGAYERHEIRYALTSSQRRCISPFPRSPACANLPPAGGHAVCPYPGPNEPSRFSPCILAGETTGEIQTLECLR